MQENLITKRVMAIALFFAVFIVFGLSLGQIMQYPEYPGEVGLHVNVLSSGCHRDDDVMVTAYMPDDGIFAQGSYLDVSRYNPASASIFLSIPYYTQPGWHIAKVDLLHEGRLADSQYVYVNVV